MQSEILSVFLYLVANFICLFNASLLLDIISFFNDFNIDNSLIVTSFCKDGFGNTYYGTFKGLIIKSQNKTSWVHEEFENLECLRNTRVFSLKYDYKSHCIWIGTISNGLFKINLDIK